VGETNPTIFPRLNTMDHELEASSIGHPNLLQPVLKQPKPDGLGDVATWSPNDVARWVGSRSNSSLHQFSDLFIEHGIGGASLIEVEEDTLKDMGVSHIGARKVLAAEIRALAIETQRDWRQREVWSGGEHRHPCCFCFPYGFPCW
jgi:hypothetical protein